MPTFVLVASFVTVTVTPDMAAPVLSEMLPMIDARSTWARSPGWAAKTKVSSRHTLRGLGIVALLFSRFFLPWSLERGQRAVFKEGRRKWPGSLKRVFFQRSLTHFEAQTGLSGQRIAAVHH